MPYFAEVRVYESSPRIQRSRDISIKIVAEHQGPVESKKIVAISRKPFFIRIRNSEIVAIVARKNQWRPEDEFLADNVVQAERLAETAGKRDKRQEPSSQCVLCQSLPGKYNYAKRCVLCQVCAEKVRGAENRETYDAKHSTDSLFARNADYAEYLASQAGLRAVRR